jgi:hypothetical protein
MRCQSKNGVWYGAVCGAGALCKYTTYVNMGVRACYVHCTKLLPMGLLAHSLTVILFFVRSFSGVCVGF